MIQKRLCSLSNKVNRPFYGMVKILIIVIWNANIFTVYETFENVRTILPITYQNTWHKLRSDFIIYWKWQGTSTIQKVLDYNFWWNCFEFSLVE